MMRIKQACAVVLTVALMGVFTGNASAYFVEDFESYTAGAELGAPWSIDFSSGGSALPYISTAGGFGGSQAMTGADELGNVKWLSRTFTPNAGDQIVASFKIKYGQNPNLGGESGVVFGGGTGLTMDVRLTRGSDTLTVWTYYTENGNQGTFNAPQGTWLEFRSTLTPGVGSTWTHLDEYRIYDDFNDQWGSWILMGQTVTAVDFDPAREMMRIVGSDRNWSYLDDVSVVLVPEPATVALLGLGGLMMMSRRRS